MFSVGVCICTRACLCEPCAIGCLQVVYAERNDAKSLVKGANSPLKAVIPTLMARVFNWVSEKTRERDWAGKKKNEPDKKKQDKYYEIMLVVKTGRKA